MIYDLFKVSNHFWMNCSQALKLSISNHNFSSPHPKHTVCSQKTLNFSSFYYENENFTYEITLDCCVFSLFRSLALPPGHCNINFININFASFLTNNFVFFILFSFLIPLKVATRKTKPVSAQLHSDYIYWRSWKHCTRVFIFHHGH